jgi:electron transfer flavoprotein alpha subunit
MAAAERTYSFKATRDFAERLVSARQTLASLAAGSEDTEDVAGLIARELATRLIRDYAPGEIAEMSQSAFMRATFETLIAAAEQVGSDRRYVAAYAEAAADADDEDRAWADATRRVASERWQAR